MERRDPNRRVVYIGYQRTWAALLLSVGAVLAAGCGGDGGAGGGGGTAAVMCGATEQTAMDGDYACAVPECDELDPNQQGVLGAAVLGPYQRRVEFTGGCRIDDGICDPAAFTNTAGAYRHKGGNRVHNWCADQYPYRNMFWIAGDPGSGADAVVRGHCFDGAYIEGGTSQIHVWETKTARYGTSRRTGRPVCSFVRRRVLISVISSVARDLPIVDVCGHEYHLVFADVALEDAWETLIDGGEIVLTDAWRFDSDPVEFIDLAKDAGVSDGVGLLKRLRNMKDIGAGFWTVATACDN